MLILVYKSAEMTVGMSSPLCKLKFIPVYK